VAMYVAAAAFMHCFYQCFPLSVNVFHALLLLVWRQGDHPARKN